MNPRNPSFQPSPETPSAHTLADTHTVENQSYALEDYNLYLADVALQEAVKREGAAASHMDLTAFGQLTGSAQVIQWGFQANKVKPEFRSHDRFGRRVDLIEFHPAYHKLMETAIVNGIHSIPWCDPRPGSNVYRAALFYLQSQVEAGHGCPITMTFASIPTIRKQASIASVWEPLITSRHYDPRNVPVAEKSGVTIGMAMTEKQGGSDVRANTTRAYPVGQWGAGEIYELVGHKYFVSAPMCDAFLVLAQAEGGISCFLVPRWRPDGSKNPLQIQQLKNKMGNVSNASSETELRGAMGWLIGDEGRGIANILEMVALTRFDCMIGSSSGMRQAMAQILHHCSQRKAFGKLLTDQPLMQNVLADLAIESEAAMALTLRMARALDNPEDEHEKLVARIGTAIGKYWICKRTPGHAYEAMECIGGSAVMEDSIMPRLYREAPVNAIWEGSGNVQCLDMLRAMSRTPGSLEALFAEIDEAKGLHPAFDRFVSTTKNLFADLSDVEFQARVLVEHLALSLQASVLLRADNAAVADAFCATRLQSGSHHMYGTMPKGVDCQSIIQRAQPQVGV
ncbi:acyl-CoA dehydrogenase family protein [Ketobacter sp.]|uniref:acyl-CoA dehydrogenase family protein n=1 Tax=Ketobacter sp. TaxID=2083498 RepID=UPI000F13A653|nr:acyl-CoA dehydrogenase family protein [Ketobacter sp.]RLT93786.1 MAG: DNA alkylation response protein [Ketobacter sp.]